MNNNDIFNLQYKAKRARANNRESNGEKIEKENRQKKVG